MGVSQWTDEPLVALSKEDRRKKSHRSLHPGTAGKEEGSQWVKQRTLERGRRNKEERDSGGKKNQKKEKGEKDSGEGGVSMGR